MVEKSRRWTEEITVGDAHISAHYKFVGRGTKSVQETLT